MRYQNPQRLRPAGLWRARAVTAAAAAATFAIAFAGSTGVSAAKSKKSTKSTSGAHWVDGTLINGNLPKAGRAASGGTITFGQTTGQTPTDIFPIINGATCSTQTFTFVANQYIPLYEGPTGARPAIEQGLSAALPPKYSNHNRTVTITIKPGLKWSDGSPVNAEDVLFDFDLIKAAATESPANYCQYASATQFPFNVKSITASGNTLVMQLTGSVNPTWFTDNQLQVTNGGLYPLPVNDWNVDATGKHLTDWNTNPKDAQAIVDNLQKVGTDVSSFATSPLWKVVDGPFKLQSFSNVNDSYVLVPNRSYGLSPKPRMAQVDVNTYTGTPAMLSALESGSLDIGHLDATQVGAIPQLTRRGASVFGGPSWGWFGGFLNFKDKANHFNKVVAQPYIRGVFAELIDQKAIIQHVYKGWAVAAYGPVPSAPRSPFIPPNVTKPAYPYSPSKAVATLKAHGWNVKPGGTTTCARPGSHANECGAGIPKGTPIKFVWANQPEAAAAAAVLESEAFGSEAKAAAGIDVTFQTKSFNFLTSNYNDQTPASKKYLNDWGVNNYGGIFTDYYPTQFGVMNTHGALNMGFYNDPKANRLMLASTVAPTTAAIKKEVSYFSHSQPVLYMPDQDWIMAVGKRIGGSADGFTSMTQQQDFFQLIYVKK